MNTEGRVMKEPANFGVLWEDAYGYTQAFPQQLVEISFTAVLPSQLRLRTE